MGKNNRGYFVSRSWTNNKLEYKSLQDRFNYNLCYFFVVLKWARSSAGEHCVDIAGVAGSIPAVPTIFFNNLAGITP